jgi:hypothetical protein
MILRRIILCPDNSLLENSSLKKKFPGGGKFFTGAFFNRMILRPNDSSPDNSSLGYFFAWEFFSGEEFSGEKSSE